MMCVCGAEIKLDRKDFNYILDRVNHYCSIQCFLNELKCVENPLGIATAKYSRLSKPMESWSVLTNSFYRSLFEVKFAEILLMSGVKFLYEPLTLMLSTGKEYTPDFYLTYHKVFVELKGVWSGSGKKKVRNAIDDDVRIEVIPYYLNTSINQLHKQLKDKYAIFT